MQWTNTETPTFAGSSGRTATAPAVVEVLAATDRDGTTLASLTKAVDGTATFDVDGTVTADAVTVGGLTPLTTSTGLRVAYAKYDFAVDGGAQGTIAPANSSTIPDNAILVGATLNSTTAVLSGGSATVAVGTSAGSSTTSIKGATGKASWSADAVLNGVPVFATPVKLSAAGTITFTIGTADLTAGVIEAWVYYVVAAA